MNLDKSIEHFVTLFDSNCLPMGMALHSSLTVHAQPFHLLGEVDLVIALCWKLLNYVRKLQSKN